MVSTVGGIAGRLRQSNLFASSTVFLYAIPRWFYWETSFWYDGNQGGKGPYDPFASSETFHNSSGNECQGDGVLVYPGKQVDLFKNHSLGMDGVVAAIRLKNFRRGVEDAGYYALAHAANPAPPRRSPRACSRRPSPRRPSTTSQSPGSAGDAGGCSTGGRRNGRPLAALGLALGLAFAARRRRRRR